MFYNGNMEIWVQHDMGVQINVQRQTTTLGTYILFDAKRLRRVLIYMTLNANYLYNDLTFLMIFFLPPPSPHWASE